MGNLQFVIILVICLCISNTFSASQKVQTTRTALHVARSLDPDSMESVAVKTRNGDLTTIIVKKRNGKSNNGTADTESKSNNTESNFVLLSSSQENHKPINSNSISNSSVSVLKSTSNATTIDLTSSTQNRSERSDIRIPDPVYVSSSMMFVKNDQNSSNKKAKSLIKVDSDGIPVVTGVRVPDDDSDRQIWRNARVINGILVPYEKSEKDVITKYKPIRKPTTIKPTRDESSEGWMKIGSVTKKPTKLMPSASAEPPIKNSWNDQKWEAFKKPVTFRPLVAQPAPFLQTIETAESMDRSRPISGQNYVQHPTGLWIASEPEENPEHKYVTDRILEYIRNINKEEMKRLSMQKFTARDARMLPTNPEESDDLQNDQQPQIQSRILHVTGSSSFPNSAMYSPSTQPPSRVSFEGVRTPVLQYAHPEFGVQSAKSEPSSQELTDSKRDFRYYSGDMRDIHADRGPFVFEPGSPTQEPEIMGDNNKRSHTPLPPYFQRPKKTFSHFYPDKHSYQPPNKYYGKYSSKDDYKSSEYPSSLYYEDVDGRPFWIRLGDSLKEQVQSGIDKMSDLTRPVVEPLVEATHKISHNLGLSAGNRELSTLREKLGSVSTSSLILPAIGIMAGGAALGLGAVAVGRYLNYDVVKMRNAKSMNNLELPDTTNMAALEALWAQDNSRSGGWQEVSSSTPEPSSTPSSSSTEKSSSDLVTTSPSTVKKSRRRRSIYSSNSDNSLQNLDLSDEIQINDETYPTNTWSDTPCSKKIFCEAMLAQSEDAGPLMDKKIHTFLSLIHPDLANAVAPHLEDVMRSIKNKDCSAYKCPSWTPIASIGGT